MKYILQLFNRGLLISLAVFFVVSSLTAQAIPQNSLNAIRRGHPFYNPGCLTQDTNSGESPISGQSIDTDITVYTPQTGGDTVQGGLASSRPGPDGEAVVRTLDDVREGRSEYVTLAGNSEYYNKEYTIPTITYLDISGTVHVLNNVRAVVHDTGGAFRTTPEGRYDLAVGIDYPTDTSSVMFRQPANGKNKIKLIPKDPSSSTVDPQSSLSEIRPDGSLPKTPAAPPAAPTTPSASSPKRLEDLTLREKLATMVFSRAFSENDISLLKTGGAGGIFARPDNENDETFFNGLKGFLGDYSGFVAVDFEGGRVQAPGSGVVGTVPSAQELGQKNEAEITTIATESGKKISDLGINMNFAPVVDIGGTNTSVIGDRAFANDAENVAKKAGAFADGMSQSNIVSVFKHFPGHGSRDGDSHTGAVSTASLSELEGRDIVPYQTLKSKAKSAIMMGHLKVPDWGDTPTSINSAAYSYVRDGVGYDGVIITDALDMAGLGSPTDEPSRAVLAIKAGADVALLNSPSSFTSAIDKLEAALSAGELDQQKIDQSVERILKLRSSVASTDTKTDEVECAPCESASGGTGTIPLDGENPKRMLSYLVGQGLTVEQAAGITGNAMAESGPSIDPAAANGTLYRGIFQWDTGSAGDRWGALVSWASSNGKDPNLFEVQLEYAWKEATDRGNIEGIKSQNSIPLATWYWGRFFEGAVIGGSSSKVPLTNVQHLDRRTQYAQSVFDKYAGSVGGSSIASASCSQASSPGQCSGNTVVPLPESEVPWTFNNSNHNRSISLPNNKDKHGPLIQGNSRHLAGTNADPNGLGEATDVFVTVGTTAFSPFDGEVLYAGGSYNGIIIKSESGDCVAALAHISTNVSIGEKVTAGQTVGEVDGAGHLHFELWVNGQVINIGKDDNPCVQGGSCPDSFTDESEEIWKKQKAALGG